MPGINSHNVFLKWIPAVFAAAMLISFFLPWVQWKDATLSGVAMPSGGFFSAAQEKFGVDNPFPQFSFAFKIFWFIPLAALAAISIVLLKKNTFWPGVVAGLLSLSLVLVYFLFSQSLVNQLGVSKSAWAMTKPWLYIQAIAAAGIILTACSDRWMLKAGLILATVAATIIGFSITSKQAEKKIFEETFESIENTRPDYTVSANDLLKEFIANDSAANKKYLEKIVTVSGAASEAEARGDSTVHIKFVDSTGSYIIFSLEKDQYEKAKNIKPGDDVSLKGSCSGSVYSEILSTTQISFKRSTLNK